MILSTFLSAVATILHTVINVYIWVIIAAALISWVRPDPYNQIVQLLYRLTEPVYERLRRLVPTVIGGVDLAPIIVLLALQFTDLFFVRLLHEFAASL
ncbi:MAG: YggT family protein [Campylobacter sp.]